MATIYEKVGENIRKIRNQKGLSQEQLSEMAKIDPKSIVQIEAGKRNPTLKTIKKIASSLETSVGKLVE